jgi:hypothetical protein
MRVDGAASAAIVFAFALVTAPFAEAQTTSAPDFARGDAWTTDFSRISVPADEIVSGGPPKDGIPAVDEPRFESVESADSWLADRDPILVIERDGVVKAYPLGILIWHEIVNDEISGLPVTATFCPLCNTALVFVAEVDGAALDFGTTGRLRSSDLIMYDRQTESWWQQALGEAIIGEHLGAVLTLYPANQFGWSMVREHYPRALVLSRDTGYPGYMERYGRNPYAGYDRMGNEPMRAFVRERTDPRLPAMERVVAVELGEGWAAPFGLLSDVRVVNAELGETPFTVFWAPGNASALDSRDIAAGRDVGQTAVFDRRLDGRLLEFEFANGRFRDVGTGSVWDLTGRAVQGTLEGRSLTRVGHGNHFWFAWIVFRPESVLWMP